MASAVDGYVGGFLHARQVVHPPVGKKQQVTHFGGDQRIEMEGNIG